MQLFTNSSIVAIPSLYVGVVKWPSMLKHQLFTPKFHKIFSFLLVVVLIDGTLIPLIFMPKRQGEKYYTKKLNYAFLDMIIYDHKRKILHLMVGFPISSCYDNHVFTNSKMQLTHEVYFFDDESFLIYFAYLFSTICIPTYKQPTTSLLGNFKFNAHLVSIQVKVKHGIGIIKGRFQSLRGLLIQIKTKNDHHINVLSIQLCAIFHNLLF